MATESDESRPKRNAGLLAALALLMLLGLAMLPRVLSTGGEGASALVPQLLERYSDAGLGAICREPEILGEAHGLCGLGGVARTAGPIARDIRFATEGPGGSGDVPAIDDWELGFSDLPALVLDGGGAAAPILGGGGSTIAGGGSAAAVFFAAAAGSSGGNNNNPGPPPGDDPGCEDDCDDPPGTPPVPEPSAALLFGLGFAFLLKSRSLRR